MAVLLLALTAAWSTAMPVRAGGTVSSVTELESYVLVTVRVPPISLAETENATGPSPSEPVKVAVAV